ncbi:MAG TPA: hypothetical protein VD884_04180 [Ohtaekwangia sp.]|nr:hypothetical protein [Ohtaekwangia sp.]
MLKNTVVILFFMFATVDVYGQDSTKSVETDKSFFVIIQAGYDVGIGSIRVSDKPEASIKNEGHLYRIRFVAGYFVRPKFSVGIAAGLEGYHQPNYNMFPVLLDLRFYKNPEGNSPFASAGLGYAIPLSDNFEQGLHNSLHVGYQLGKGRKTPIMASIGVDMQYIKNAKGTYEVRRMGTAYIESSIWLTSLSFNLAMRF